MKDNNLKQAYLITINDLEIELRSTEWYKFRYRKELIEEIKKYENLLKQDNEI